MFRRYCWLQPVPRNFAVSKRRLQHWRWWGPVYQQTPEYQLLKRLEMQREHVDAIARTGASTVGWLLPYRHDFRQCFVSFASRGQPEEADLILYYMSSCPQAILPIGIWMLGQCADRFRLCGLADFRVSPSPQIRKHTAKALRRLEAWNLLDEMATLFPGDARVQWYARAPLSRASFPTRLSHYVSTVNDSHADEVMTPSTMPFWSRDDAWNFSPPKSVQAIRRMLRRIRHWVRWGVT